MTSYTPSATRRGGPCEVCGKPTTRNRNRFCSLPCRDAARPTIPKPACSVEACDEPQRCKGLCQLHYGRLLQFGDALADVRPPNRLGVQVRPLEDRFWEKVEKTDACWLWTGALSHGYGSISVWIDGKKRLNGAHRVAYELLVGPIPKGLHIDHLCRNPPCVNPAHLEPVTPAENTRRGLAAVRRAACNKGHLRTDDNTHTQPSGRRVCLTCNGGAA